MTVEPVLVVAVIQGSSRTVNSLEIEQEVGRPPVPYPTPSSASPLYCAPLPPPPSTLSTLKFRAELELWLCLWKLLLL